MYRGYDPTYVFSPRQLQTEVYDAVANPRISECQPSTQPESQFLAQREKGVESLVHIRGPAVEKTPLRPLGDAGTRQPADRGLEFP
jgi:hypothetical protein